MRRHDDNQVVQARVWEYISSGSCRLRIGILTQIILEGADEHELAMPDYAFLLRHGKSIVLWDTGLAADLSIYPPAAQKRMPTFKRTSS